MAVNSQLNFSGLLRPPCAGRTPRGPTCGEWWMRFAQVPPALNRFTKAIDKNTAQNIFKLLLKYRPEDKAAKKERLLREAEAREQNKTVRSCLSLSLNGPSGLWLVHDLAIHRLL